MGCNYLKREKIAFPTEINFPALNKSYSVKFESLNLKPSLIETPLHLCFMGKKDDFWSFIPLFKSWLKKIAQHLLTPKFHEMSDLTQLSYHKVTWKFQKTRWGSCSNKASINLNVALLLMRLELVEHIMLHELCHTRFLNHSSKFWKLMAEHQPHYLTFKNELKSVHHSFPQWSRALF